MATGNTRLVRYIATAIVVSLLFRCFHWQRHHLRPRVTDHATTRSYSDSSTSSPTRNTKACPSRLELSGKEDGANRRQKSLHCNNRPMALPSNLHLVPLLRSLLRSLLRPQPRNRLPSLPPPRKTRPSKITLAVT